MEKRGSGERRRMNMYLLQAAADLRGSGYPGSGTAVDELTYLANLPPTNDTPTQM